VGSVPENPTVRGWLYQPLLSGAGTDAVTLTGAVASYPNVKAAELVLPALSVHEAETFAVGLSGPLYVADVVPTPGVQVARPEVASARANVTETGDVYQPFAFGPRSGVTVTAGGVASYLNWTAAGVLTLPALSRQVPLIVVLEVSGPVYVDGAEQEAIPEVASDPVNAIATGRLYQPFQSALREGVAAAVGRSLSILNCRWNGIVAFPSVAVQSRASLLERKVFTIGQVVSLAPCTEI
jgi:hypothetical protein